MKLGLGVAVLWCAGCAGVTPDPVASVPRGHPFLWEATGPGTIRLYGAYRRECQEDMPPAVTAAFNGSDTMVSLLAASDPNDFAASNVSAGMVFLPSPKTLLDYLSWDQLKELEYRFASGRSDYRIAGVPNGNVRFLRPIVVMAYLEHVRTCKITTEHPLLLEAQRSGKKILWLEDRATFPELIDDAFDAKAMPQAIADDDWAKREHIRTLTAYRAGDESVFVIPDRSVEATLRSHHPAWLARLDALAHTGRVFVELQVSHMVGPTGLIAGLEKMGYSVRRY